MSKLKSLLILIVAVATTTSCVETIDPNENLLGTWSVTKVEGRQITNGVYGIVLTDDSPEGFISFDDNGWGEQDYSFTLFGTDYPFNSRFVYTTNDTEIQIKLIGEDDMIWNRILNESNLQQASYDIYINEMLTVEYTLTLEQ